MDIEKVNDILQNGIEHFLSGKFETAGMYFSLVLSEEADNDVAKFGVMCIDAIDDGMIEARDMFNIYIFLPEDQKKSMLNTFDKYQSSELYDSSISDYIYDMMNQYGSSNDIYNRSYNSIEELLSEFTSDIKSDPESYDSDFLLGKMYEKLGDYEKAIDYLTRAFRTKPFDTKLQNEIMQVVKKKNEG